MLDGKIDGNEHNPEIHKLLRSLYEARIVHGDKIPEGMQIQGVDVIDPTQSRISHQQALGREIDQIHARGDVACVVIFRPVETEKSTIAAFNTYNDPNRYAVVTPDRALSLLGNCDANQGLRSSVTRRRNAVLGLSS